MKYKTENKILKTSVFQFYYKLAPMGKIYFKILKMGDINQRQSQTPLPGGQTPTKCKLNYFILIILIDFPILHFQDLQTGAMHT